MVTLQAQHVPGWRHRSTRCFAGFQYSAFLRDEGSLLTVTVEEFTLPERIWCDTTELLFILA